MYPIRLTTLPFLFMLIFLHGCQPQEMIRVGLVESSHSRPSFSDDTDSQSLITCARIHRQYLDSLPSSYRATIAGKTYPLSWLQHSMDEFISFLETHPSPDIMNGWLKKYYRIIAAEGRKGKYAQEMLVTGYYEPLFAGNHMHKPPYIYPLYSPPSSIVKQKKKKSSASSIGRINSKGRFVPFWTRAEIENSSKLTGNELVYLKDPIDSFLLHVQGSGRIQFPDGTIKPVRFAGHNGHKYKSIGKLLVDEGKLTLKEASIPTIRAYLEKHPEDQQRVLQSNPRFIFFKWGNTKKAQGSLGQPLTPGRSIAIDRKALPDSTFAWLETQIPVIDEKGKIVTWKTTRRFVFPQDSGAAIKGTGRVDIFWGSGLYAKTAANHMKEPGRLYFFIKKGFKAEH